jgi:CBS domain-containing protein
MHTVAQILQSKRHRTVFSIAPAAPMLQALELMAEQGIGALLVMEGRQIVGIVSERDYARKVELRGRTCKDTQVRDIMTANVMYVPPHHTNEQCMALMTENRLRHLPVLEGDELIGLISIGDLVKDLVSEQQFIIQQLEHYIMGER